MRRGDRRRCAGTAARDAAGRAECPCASNCARAVPGERHERVVTRATRGGEERTTKRSARLVVQDRVAGCGHACEQREVRVVARVEEQGRLVAVERGQPRFEPLVFCRVPREKARSGRADQLLLRARIGPEPLPLREHLAVQRGVAREAEVVVRAEVDRVGRCRDERGERERRRAHGRARAPREQQRTSRSARAPGGVSVRSLPATRLDSSEAERRASTKLLKARRISCASCSRALGQVEGLRSEGVHAKLNAETALRSKRGPTRARCPRSSRARRRSS